MAGRLRETIASGINNKANWEGTDIDLQEWSIEVGGDDADITDTSTAGIKRSMTVTDEYTMSANALWKYGSQPTDNPPALARGCVGTLRLYLSSEKFVEAEAEIKTFSVTSQVAGAVTFTFTAEFQTAIDWPSASLFSSSSSSSSST